jgi:tetratricopeptide (TPR) repeat protein
MAKKQRKPQLPKKGFIAAPPAKKKNYRSERFIPYIMATEVGIHEAATMDDSLNDAAVRAGVNRLISQLRQGESVAPQSDKASGGAQLIDWRMRDNLWRAFDQHGPIPNEDLIGCLKTILDSIETWSGPPLGQRGYLGYLAGFMKQLGVNVQLLSHKEAAAIGLVESEPEPALPPGYDPDKMPLEELGRFWLEHDAEIIELIDDFANRIEAEIRDGRAEAAVRVCRRLLAETDDPDQQAELHFHIGVGLRHLGQLADSIEALQTAIELQEDFAGALSELGETYFVKGDYQSAIATWRHELEVVPENHRAWLNIARGYRALGEDQREEHALRRMIEHQPGSVEALTLLVECLRRQGKEQEALLISRRVAGTLPAPPVGFFDWAYWLRLKLTMPGYGPDPLKALAQEEKQEKRPYHQSWLNLLKAVACQQTGNAEAARRELALARERSSSPQVWQRQLDLMREFFPTFRPDVTEATEEISGEGEPEPPAGTFGRSRAEPMTTRGAPKAKPSQDGFWEKLLGRRR